MRLNAPKFVTWLVALILGVLGILIWPDVGIIAKPSFIKVAAASLAFYLEGAAFIILCLSTFLKGF